MPSEPVIPITVGTCTLCGGDPSAGPCVACQAVRAPHPDLAARAAVADDRRDPRQQHRIPGGARATDPPLTTRACADWMGFTTSWIRAAIEEGVVVRGVLVKLDAETMVLNGRRMHRIHLDRFVCFLKAIGWKRIPKLPATIAITPPN